MTGFCHLKTDTCFGPYTGLSRLERTLKARITSAPEGSYTQRLFNDRNLLKAKIMEEAGELCEASTQEHIAAEAADLIYFALTKCIASGVDLQAIESNLNLKSLKTTRRRGDAKPQWSKQFSSDTSPQFPKHVEGDASSRNASEKVVIESLPDAEQRIQMTRLIASQTDHRIIQNALRRPAQRDSDKVVKITTAIINEVRQNGDAAVLRYTHQFEKATSLKSPILHAPFASELMTLSPETKEAIDISFENIKRFHAAQKDQEPLLVETMPGVVCSRFSRAITGVGLYIPGGTAILPSTALMLGVPAMVAGCERIVFASPPKADGTVTPEIVYIAHRVGADCIVLAGGAQAIAAMAYGTETIPKVDKILGPGNQFVTSAKMIVSNDTNAGVSIDMPAGPSEVLVIADKTAKPAFVASDLLSQAEHGKDSQVVLLTVGLDNNELEAIEQELHKQACALPRVEIVREAIEHSITIAVDSIEEALKLSNTYAPEHLILQVNDAESILPMIQNAGSVFVGMWTPESVGDYSAGVNHSLRMLFFVPPERWYVLPVTVQTNFVYSNLRICQTIFWCQFRLVHETHHQFQANPRRS